MTSAVYIWVFFTGKLYADMGLQGYYLIISVIGWYWWVSGGRRKAEGRREEVAKGRMGEEVVQAGLPSLESLPRDSGGQGVGLYVSDIQMVTKVSRRILIILTIVFIFLYTSMWLLLDNFTDSPVPGRDSFITSLSIIATWMLARKIIEHWYLWILVNAVAMTLFLFRGSYPTAILYAVYFIMSFIGLKEWRKTIPHPPTPRHFGRGRLFSRGRRGVRK
jgi:nicotinamide mononucleotide transporter